MTVTTSHLIVNGLRIKNKLETQEVSVLLQLMEKLIVLVNGVKFIIFHIIT